MQLIRLISFTDKGNKLAQRIIEGSSDAYFEVWNRDEGLSIFISESFAMAVPVMFISACGIAVRLIAPFVRDKLKDSAVVVCDEAGRYVIPVLSGHVGGANHIAKCVAQIIGGEAVITTATDVNGLFAADSFAVINRLKIYDREGIKEVSSLLLDRGYITVSISDDIDFDETQIPAELKLVPYSYIEGADLIISNRIEDRERCRLYLKPKLYTVGIGCRKGISEDIINKQLATALDKAGIDPEGPDIACIASIDFKAAEHGLLKCAAGKGLKLVTFSDRELLKVKGDFTESEFVKEVTGVSNVCERAAMAAAGEGAELTLKKQSGDGVTVAVARRKVRIKRWKE